MFKAKALAVTICAVLALSGLSSLGAESRSAPDLPAGEMQAKARTACMECHEARIILQQRLSKATWTKEVDKMIKWGAVVDPKDRDALIDYLSTNFPADKAPEPAARVTK
jgi:mono/diheme cytochrome c family protein